MLGEGITMGLGLIDKIARGFLPAPVHKTFRHTASAPTAILIVFPVRHNPFHAVIFLYRDK